MRPFIRLAPGVVLAGLFLAGCAGSGVPEPPQRPEKAVEAWVEIEVPRMT